MDAALGMAIFIVVFIVIPWGLIFGLRLVGRRRGYDNLHAPPQDELLADRPLRCRLNLFHRWRSMRTPTGDRYQRCLDCGKTRDIPTAAALGCLVQRHRQVERMALIGLPWPFPSWSRRTGASEGSAAGRGPGPSSVRGGSASDG